MIESSRGLIKSAIPRQIPGACHGSCAPIKFDKQMPISDRAAVGGAMKAMREHPWKKSVNCRLVVVKKLKWLDTGHCIWPVLVSRVSKHVCLWLWLWLCDIYEYIDIYELVNECVCLCMTN